MKNISKKSVTLVKKMESYLAANGINRFELKRIRADIVSMIADAEARGDSAESIFPNGGQDFCDEVLKNAVKKRWYEYVLSILTYMAISFAVVFPIVILGTYLFPNEGEAVRGVIIDIDAVDLLIPCLAAPVYFYKKTLCRTYDFYCACSAYCRNYRSCALRRVRRRARNYEHKLGCFMDNRNGGCRA